MAKKAATESIGPEIKRQKFGWGIRLSLRPFLDKKLAALEITTDVAVAQEGRAPQVKTWFSGVTMATPLRATDVVIWMEAMKAMQEEARKLIEKAKT